MEFRVLGKEVKHAWLILAVVILGAFFLRKGFSVGSMFHRYADAGSYKAGNFEYRAKDVSEIEVNWVSSDITVKQSGSDKLSVKENDRGLNEKQKLHWRISGDKLIIQYCKSGYHGRFPSNTKDLTIEVPEGISLNIDGVSSDIALTGSQNYDNFSLDTVSGDIRFDEVEADKIKINTVSGEIKGGKVSSDKAELHTTSGDVRLEPAGSDKLKIGTVSGDVTLLSLPDGGAEIEYSHVSGSLSTDREYEKDGNKYNFGRGSSKIDVDTVSGDLKL